MLHPQPGKNKVLSLSNKLPTLKKIICDQRKQLLEKIRELPLTGKVRIMNVAVGMSVHFHGGIRTALPITLS